MIFYSIKKIYMWALKDGLKLESVKQGHYLTIKIRDSLGLAYGTPLYTCESIDMMRKAVEDVLQGKANDV